MSSASANDRTSRSLLALLELSKALQSEVDLDSLLGVIVENASAVVDAERTSIFVFNPARGVLWTRFAQGLGSTRIELERGSGVAGEVARTLEMVNIADAYTDPRFNPESDRRTGFRTHSILAAPIFDSAGRLLGVVQSVNKVSADRFDAQDEPLMMAIASHVGVAMERAADTASRLENERLSEALKLASEIQMRMLPSGSITASDELSCDLQAFIRPAKVVGGDLYDYALSDERLYFCIGDVSGKGIGSALVMALTKTLFRANVPYFDDAAKLTEAVNIRLCEETGPTMFVTAFCGFLDLDDGTLRFCNAGHDRPFILRHDGSVEIMDSKPGIALGVLPKFTYPLQQMTLAPGDAIFLYTDGVTEATDGVERLFSLDRLGAVLTRHATKDARAIIDAVAEAVDRFVEGAPQADDVTMLCLRYTG
ncbi:MAG TPA: GAF domain-containing SpoIIE family protein phosphatase [Thermoanaerobaculia bacterium]|nr:GAF domain-containing SpoIIE family protein phosphatase [Thermoanaerobaculia bacterium]